MNKTAVMHCVCVYVCVCLCVCEWWWCGVGRNCIKKSAVMHLCVRLCACVCVVCMCVCGVCGDWGGGMRWCVNKSANKPPSREDGKRYLILREIILDVVVFTGPN